LLVNCKPEICKKQKFNMISSVLLNEDDRIHYSGDTSAYGNLPFICDSLDNPDPLMPDTTPGNDPKIPGQYDYWDHVDYVIDLAAMNGMYISLHPTWGYWVSGSYKAIRKKRFEKKIKIHLVFIIIHIKEDK